MVWQIRSYSTSPLQKGMDCQIESLFKGGLIILLTLKQLQKYLLIADYQTIYSQQ